MPLFILGKRTHNYEAWKNHKELLREYTLATRMIRGGYPEYIKVANNIKKQIDLNKITT